MTVVTAFFDIKRGEEGDGRSTSEYEQWIKKTMTLNSNFYVVTDEKHKHLFTGDRVYVKTMNFEDSPFYKYNAAIKKNISTPEFLSKIKHPSRVECKLAEYNTINFCKFNYLEMAVTDNPWNSEHFVWLDAGGSRWFVNMDLSRPWPTSKLFEKFAGTLIVEQRHDLHTYPINDDFVWDSVNLICGTTFGGTKEAIHKVANLAEEALQYMISRGSAGIDQMGLAMVWKKHPELFTTFYTPSPHHAGLVNLLAY